jgi:hypothetical protein
MIWIPLPGLTPFLYKSQGKTGYNGICQSFEVQGYIIVCVVVFFVELLTSSVKASFS